MPAVPMESSVPKPRARCAPSSATPALLPTACADRQRCTPSIESAVSAAGSVSSVRERDVLRRTERSLDGERVYLAAEPNLGVLADQVARALRGNGATVVLDTSGDDHSVLAAQANRFEALVFVELSRAATTQYPLFVLRQSDRAIRGRLLPRHEIDAGPGEGGLGRRSARRSDLSALT